MSKRSRGEVIFFGDLRSPFVVYAAINEFGGSRRADRDDFRLDLIDFAEGASKLIVWSFSAEKVVSIEVMFCAASCLGLMTLLPARL